MNIDQTKAKVQIIVHNYMHDQTYCPYCGPCSGLHRMQLVEPLLWKHSCGAIHDERQCIIKKEKHDA